MPDLANTLIFHKLHCHKCCNSNYRVCVPRNFSSLASPGQHCCKLLTWILGKAIIGMGKSVLEFLISAPVSWKTCPLYTQHHAGNYLSN